MPKNNAMKKFTMLFTIALCILLINCNPERETYSHTDWDADGDGQLNDAEFKTAFDKIGYYDHWDENKDGALKEDEWGNGIKRDYANYELGSHGNYSDWDMNDDADLDEEEFSKGAFNMWDVDNDGYVEGTEYEEWYYGIDDGKEYAAATEEED